MSSGPRDAALLAIEQLRVEFAAFAAVREVSFELAEGETLGLVGESGSGKSSLARALLRLVPSASGRVWWRGEDLLAWDAATLRARRRDLQIVFQDPMASLNPRMRVGDALAEPLRIFEPRLDARARASKVGQMLERVGLTADMARRYPQEFSGGQCQRIGIARAMIVRPKLLVCDEPVSSLDVSIQGQIVNLLVDLQKELGTAMLFISHNLAVVRHLSHRVMVMYRGRLVEIADRDVLFDAPAHPYTRALLAAVPDPTRGVAGRALTTAEEFTGSQIQAADSPAGCAFHGRCPYVQPACLAHVPPLEAVGEGHVAACRRWREVVYS
jgi:oligopeptide transport system ATP-binding protein